MRVRWYSHAILLFACNIVMGSALNTTSRAKPIIIDTDLFSDVDDVGALAVANVFHNCGLVDLRGVMINTHSKYGATCASSVNTYYGNGAVPIGALRPLTNESFFDSMGFTLGEFASKVAHHWPRTLDDASQTSEPADLYRKLLASAEDRGITLISIGFLTNIATLLRSSSEDGVTGIDLVSSKVRELVVMGGKFPEGRGYNFWAEPRSAYYVFNNWPSNVPITYCGGELGKDVFSGNNLAEHAPADSPILAAYQWYVGRCKTVRESWDPLTILYAVLGLEGFEDLGLTSPFAFANQHGYNSVMRNGSNVWVNDSSVTNQHWLKLANGVTNTSVASMLDQIFAHDPQDTTCF